MNKQCLRTSVYSILSRRDVRDLVDFLWKNRYKQVFRRYFMQIVSSGMTDVGVKRTHNEDNFLINDELHLYVVCDGMGGHAGGEIASAIAVHTIEEVMLTSILGSASEESAQVSIYGSVALTKEGLEQLKVNEAEERESLSDINDITMERLRHAVRLAGARIHDVAQNEARYRGMGTTCVAALIERSNLFVAHVGDSRAYIYREEGIEQMTEDHSLVNERIRAGILSPEEAKNHRLKNIITRSLGFNQEVEVDVQVRAILNDDRVLLCSDGLCNLVEDTEMMECMKQHSPQRAARELIKLACKRGGDDNISVVIVHVANLH
jgi:PPM family protein phosphatase